MHEDILSLFAGIAEDFKRLQDKAVRREDRKLRGKHKKGQEGLREEEGLSDQQDG